MRKLILFLSVLVLTSCVTTGSKSALEVLPATMHSLFSACERGSGGISIEVVPSAIISQPYRGQIDWRSRNGRWTLENADDLGQTAIGIRSAEDQINVYGAMAHLFPNLSLGSNGQLLAKGYFSGFLADEIPCLLKGKIPVGWQYYMLSHSQKGLKWKIYFKDKYRQIKLELNMNNAGGLVKQCYELRWSSHLGIAKHQVVVCTDQKKGKKSSSLYFNSAEIMNWKIFEDK